MWGPAQYVFRNLTEKISRIRIQELASILRNTTSNATFTPLISTKHKKNGYQIWGTGDFYLRQFRSGFE